MEVVIPDKDVEDPKVQCENHMIEQLPTHD